MSQVQGSPPLITHHPVNTTVVRNDPVTLECRASGNPTPKIDWYRQNGELVDTSSANPSSHRLLLPDGSLFFLRAVHSKREQDAGIYYCVARNTEGVARSDYAFLSVSYLKDEFRSGASEQTTLFGKDVYLKCGPPEGHPTPIIKWKKDGEYYDLTSDKRIKIDGDGNLIILSASQRDEGKYQCTAENKAGIKVSKPILLRVHEPPYIVTSPQDRKAIAGESLVLDCVVGGTPEPLIHWIKDEETANGALILGKGLVLDNLRPSDEGRYYCVAQNSVGRITTSAYVSVLDRPRLTLSSPLNTVVVAGKETVSLNCEASGSPSPFIFWSKEGFPAESYHVGSSSHHNFVLSAENSLVFNVPKPEDSGHYTCTAINEIGVSSFTSHLLVYDPNNFVSANHYNLYHYQPNFLEDELRSSDSEIVFDQLSSPTPTTIKIHWNFGSHYKEYCEGFVLRYKKTLEIESLKTVVISGSNVTFFELRNLEEHTRYDVFVQPLFTNGLLGRSSVLVSQLTSPSFPSIAPRILEAHLLNSSTIFLSWETLPEEHINGPLLGYEILIQGNGTSVNNTVSSSTTQITVLVNGMTPNIIYTIQISAFNSIGHGPFSSPLEIFERSSEEELSNVTAKLTLLISLLGALSLIVIFISGLLYYTRKMSLVAKDKETLGYLPTSTSDEFHCTLYSETSKKDLWIDRRWNGVDFEKGSNSSDKKLLSSSQTHSDGEYAYVQNNGSFTSSSSKTSPEPYATTDILKKESCSYRQHLESRHHWNSSSDHLQSKIPNLADFLPPPPSHPPPFLLNRSQKSDISPKSLFHHPNYSFSSSSSSSSSSSHYKIRPNLTGVPSPRNAFYEEDSHVYNRPSNTTSLSPVHQK